MARVKFKGWNCNVTTGKYYNDRLALRLTDVKDHSLIATVTVNVPEVYVPEGCAIIKDYSENEGMYAALCDAGLVKDYLGLVEVGRTVCPLVSLNMDKIAIR